MFPNDVFKKITDDFGMHADVTAAYSLQEWLESHDYRQHINLQDFFTRDSFQAAIMNIYSRIETTGEDLLCFLVGESDKEQVSPLYLGFKTPLTAEQEQIILEELKNVRIDYLTDNLAKITVL